MREGTKEVGVAEEEVWEEGGGRARPMRDRHQKEVEERGRIYIFNSGGKFLRRGGGRGWRWRPRWMVAGSIPDEGEDKIVDDTFLARGKNDIEEPKGMSL